MLPDEVELLIEARMSTHEVISRLIESQIGLLQNKIDELTRELEKLTSINTVCEYQTQSIDDSIRCDETLDVIKSLPIFDGKNSYVSWREAANSSMLLYNKGSRKYYAALTILRNKIIADANDMLTNHGTVLNFDAILSRLDFAYADKRPLHIIEQELSVMRQGSLSIIDYYNEVNKKLTSLINKTIMTHGSRSELTNELNKKNRQYALRVFITGLNPPLANIIFSLSPSDLPNALAKAQELDANNVRANFAFQFNRNNLNRNQNHLRSPQNNFPRIQNNQPIRIEAKPELMELGSSANIIQKPPQNNGFRSNFRPFAHNQTFSNGNYRQPFTSNNRPNFNNFQQGIKRQFPGSKQLSYQPQVKAQRINNLNEDVFLEEGSSCPTFG